MDIRQEMEARKVCVVVPTYNNGRTVADVVRRIAAITPQIIVVIDGCTDDTREQLAQLKEIPLTLVDYAQNKGKGHALVAGFRKAKEMGYDYAITIDSDGQHFPEDIPQFIEALQQHPGALIIGARNLQEKNMPGGNTFANKFSNFWFTVQTFKRLPDTQTGYRLYPLHKLSGTRLITSRYEAELELLARGRTRDTFPSDGRFRTNISAEHSTLFPGSRLWLAQDAVPAAEAFYLFAFRTVVLPRRNVSVPAALHVGVLSSV